MKIKLRQFVKIFVSIVLILLIPEFIFACTCTNTNNISDKEAEKQLKNYSAIFFGEVISIEEESTSSHDSKGYFAGYKPVKFKVLQTWKGTESPEITVEADMESSCNAPVYVGDKVMIYAFENKEFSSRFLINSCSINHFDNEKMKKIYGEGKVIEHPTPSPTPSEPAEGFWSNLWKKITSFFV